MVGRARAARSPALVLLAGRARAVRSPALVVLARRACAERGRARLICQQSQEIIIRHFRRQNLGDPHLKQRNYNSSFSSSKSA